MPEEPQKLTIPLTNIPVSKKLTVTGTVVGSLLAAIPVIAPHLEKIDSAKLAIITVPPALVAVTYIICEAAIDFARARKTSGDCAGVALVAQHNKSRKAAEARADTAERFINENGAGEVFEEYRSRE